MVENQHLTKDHSLFPCTGNGCRIEFQQKFRTLQAAENCDLN